MDYVKLNDRNLGINLYLDVFKLLEVDNPLLVVKVFVFNKWFRDDHMLKLVG